MSKSTLPEWCRFDVNLLESEAYLRMPGEIRNEAYLYLLALTGRSRKQRTDGTLSLVVARDIASRMGVPAEPMLKALGARNVALVRVQKQKVHVLKYAKWQQTKAEIEEVQRHRQEAGRAGGIQSGLSRREASAKQMGSKAEPEERREEREKSLNASNALKDDPALELGVAMHELLGRVLSTTDLIECQGALNQYAYLTGAELAARAYNHVDYCKDHDLPIPRSVGGFQDTWRRENDYRADHGIPKAERVAGGRTTGLTKAFPVAS